MNECNIDSSALNFPIYALIMEEIQTQIETKLVTKLHGLKKNLVVTFPSLEVHFLYCHDCALFVKIVWMLFR
jgi:ribosomal protein S26